MSGQNAIVIVVDRLGAGYLGPYGNTWVETPAFNRLASQSLLWEHVFSTNPTLAGTYRTIQSGRHPLVADSTNTPNLWDRMRKSGIHSTLFTDELQLGQFLPGDAFDEQIEYPAEGVHSPATSWDESQLCRMFLAGLDWLTQARDDYCLVFHCRGMSGAWDAPRGFRERFVDDEDPPAIDFVDPPDLDLGSTADPDVMLGYSQAYAGQVALLDRCLEALLEELTERRILDNSLLILTSARGYPLGEHGRIGPCGDLLHEELLHLPMLIRRSDQRHAMERCQMLAEPADLHATLAEWFQLPPGATGDGAISLLTPSLDVLRRESVVSVLDGGRSLRTPAWYLRRATDSKVELYAKPDDRWEVNEVADRCAPIVEELAAHLTEYESLAVADRLAEVSPLAEHLLRRVD